MEGGAWGGRSQTVSKSWVDVRIKQDNAYKMLSTMPSTEKLANTVIIVYSM